MNCILIPTAQEELQLAMSYYEDCREGLGREFLKAFKKNLSYISIFPEAWAELESGYRRCLIKNYPYGMFYKVDEDLVVILSIFHLSQKPRF